MWLTTLLLYNSNRAAYKMTNHLCQFNFKTILCKSQLQQVMELNTGWVSIVHTNHRVLLLKLYPFWPYGLCICKTNPVVPSSVSALEPGFVACSPLKPRAIPVCCEVLHRQLWGVLVTIWNRIGGSVLVTTRFLVPSLFAFRGFPVWHRAVNKRRWGRSWAQLSREGILRILKLPCLPFPCRLVVLCYR